MEYYKSLIQELNNATKAYDEGRPIMDDKSWDELYYKIEAYEQQHGFALPESPTQSISYEVVNELKKVEHSSPMLSLAKTKSIDDLEDFCKDHSCFISLKLDGLTLRLTYAAGRLIRAETRGNGIIGEDITHNARVIKGIPNRLKVPANLVIDGEVICTDSDFSPFANEYKNSRNFAAGSLRLLDAMECAKRNLTFVVWNVVEGMEIDEFEFHTKKLFNLSYYSEQFIIVPLYIIRSDISGYIENLKEIASEKGYPIDGMVVKYDDIAYGKSLGATAHHWRNGIAFKFFDESVETQLINIEWSMGRTGQITPIAVFQKINIDGTEISRANLFNLSIMESTLGPTPFEGQIIYVVKRNQIIPYIEKAKGVNNEWI